MKKNISRRKDRERERYCVWVHDRKRDNEKLCENHMRYVLLDREKILRDLKIKRDK